MIRALVVDDEPPARENLRLLLADEDDIEIVEECGSGARAVAAIREHDPDLVFLDVQMPGIDGFEVIRAVGPERMPITVFVTAYDRYAVDAFEAEALDYLLKPFDDRRFGAALDRARARLKEQADGSLARRMIALMGEVRPQHPGHSGHPEQPERPGDGDGDGEEVRTGHLTRLTVRERDRVRLLRVDAVDYFEAAGDYVRAHEGGRTHLLDDTMRSLEEALDPRRFVRIHRSHIVRIDRIRELEPFLHGDWMVRLQDGTELRLSRTRRKALERALGRRL